MSSTGNRTGNPFHISGVVPSLTVKADMGPIRTEVGIGALMPWAGRLWMVTYLSNRIKSGGGTGLYEIDESFNMRRHPESVEGCFANRMMHGASDQIIIGPHVIDTKGNVSTMEQLKKWRLTATAAHLEDPENKFYCVAMDGKFWEVDIHTLDSKLLFDLTEELDIEAVDPYSAKGSRGSGSQPHFKGAYTGNGRVVVTNNTYTESDFLGGTTDGRLAEWDGDTWRILERAPFNEVAGHEMGTRAMFATGWDRASAILEVFVGGCWTRYRLPKGSCTYDWYTATEWPRIREVEHERLLMDCHGIFYELSPYTYDGKVWGITPICNHLRVVPDFCSWQGLLVFGGDHATPRRDGYILAGEPQSGLWFGKTDDLWRFGKPQGWGGPWCHTPVEAGEASDPYLMTGFDQKVMHFQHDADQTVTFIIEVDFLGVQRWCEYAAIQVPSGGYEHHVFPSGFSAHWIRVVCDTACKTTVQLTYT
jgi:hypothetical protein